MSPRAKGKVYKVRLVPPSAGALFPSQDEYVLQALSPGRSTERYGRDWIVGRTSREGDILTGRIGFRGAEGMAEVWDEEAKDFREVAVPAGLTAPFAVNLRTLLLVLQPRGSAIKLNGLIGAFRSLLAQDGEQWRILTPTKEMSLAQWRATVDVVTHVRFRLRKPNPHWAGAPDLEAVMEQAEAQIAKLELSASDGLDTASPFVEQSQVHVDRGYGEAIYVGVRGFGTQDRRESVYNSNLGSEEEVIELTVGDDGEVAQIDLAHTLVDDDPERDTGGQGQDQ